MGGGGRWSSSVGGKITIMGALSGVKGMKLDPTPEEREDLRELLINRVGFQDVTGMQDFNNALLGNYANHLANLERKYGVIGSTGTVLAGADGTGFYGAAGELGDGRMALVLNKKLGQNRLSTYLNAQRREQAEGYKSATDDKITSVANYTITHEYGHLLHAMMAKRLGKTERQISNEIRQIAETRYGGSNKNISGYGRTNGQEFFAEAFASSQLGAPNPAGKAMLDWLKRNGY